jgi:hypothetical protein
MAKKLSFIGLVIIMAALVAAGSKAVGVTAPPITEMAAPTTASTPDPSNCLDDELNFTEDRLGPNIPHDAYNSTEHPGLKPPPNLETQIKLQRCYDLFSWQSFLAINWPVDEAGKPTQNITDSGSPQWTTWKESYEVFKEDGTEPADWDAPRTLPTTSEIPPLTSIPDPYDKNTRILFQVNQVNSKLPLWDQNGNMVYYEVLLNQSEFDFIKMNELYHLQGQINFYKARNQSDGQSVVVLPFGTLNHEQIGAIELKLAWKIIDQADIPSRFYTMEAYIPDKDQNIWVKKTVGLVGMHIAHKTLSSDQWVWSTFEHVDNLQVNDMEVLKYTEEGKILEPSFNNPNCPTCPVNVEPELDAQGLLRTQVMRLIPIPETAESLNFQVQPLLAAEGSVWQYYELINTQYATNPTSPPTSPDHGLPENITNKSGGMPTPVYLVNSVIETYDQEGNQEASDLVQGPLNNAKQIVFGAQSCMGCHFSAGIATRFITDKDGNKQAIFEPGMADFSWLLQTRAHWQRGN